MAAAVRLFAIRVHCSRFGRRTWTRAVDCNRLEVHTATRRRAHSTPAAGAATTASPQPRLPPRLRLSRPVPAATGACGGNSGVLNAAVRLLALGATGVVGLFAGYFIGSVVKEAVREPTPEELETRQLEVAAEGGDIDATHTLGVRYATAAGVPQDLERSVSLYRRAAEAGHAGARCRLGAAYRTGCGVSPPTNFLDH